MTTGFILLDKEVNISSAKALYSVKKLVPKGTKVGHAGTLDPFASGLLIVGIERATRAIEYVMGMNKTYEFTVEWGKETDTNDCTGTVIHSSEVIPTIHDIEKLLDKFQGEILQTPPKYSAVNVNGKRAYNLARNGVNFDLAPKKVQIYHLKILHHEKNITMFEMDCSKGCYVRSVANDLAKNLNTYGHVTQLRRTKIGRFSVKDASMKILSIFDILNYPILEISNDEAYKIRNGIKQDIDVSERSFIVNDQLNLLCIAEKIDQEVKLKRIY